MRHLFLSRNHRRDRYKGRLLNLAAIESSRRFSLSKPSSCVSRLDIHKYGFTVGAVTTEKAAEIKFFSQQVTRSGRFWDFDSGIGSYCIDTGSAENLV
jgi:hypothetical protein